MLSSKNIRVLPKDLAEKIAAGEVVERPASVIKELVENALDAHSSHIRVELEDGGRKRIQIVDDGWGIIEDQLATALERHATSKINSLDDLWNLNTMGFRGEALPSIAAVSRFTIESKTRQGEGRKLYLEGGRVLKDERLSPQSPVRGLSGTSVTVEDLFYNVPARLKFLKAKSAESAQVRELLERIALCNPAIAFTLLSEGRKSLSLPAASNAAERVAAVLDTKAENIETFETQFEDLTVRGWLDRDGRAPNSRHVYLSVNSRMVRDKLLQQAVLVGLRPRMMEGEYPRLFLAVDVPPADVDVNVHPAKSEVRFRKSRDVFQLVHGALDKLAKTPSKAYYSVRLPEATSERERTLEQTISPLSASETRAPEQPRLFQSEQVRYKIKQDLGTEPRREEISTSEPVRETPAPGADFTSMHYIGQLKNTYLLFQDQDGLVVIDQHAAHERVNYERIKTDFLKSGLEPQPLLVSITVKCRPEDIAVALDHAESFTKLGFEFEAFGDNCLLLRSVPVGVDDTRAGQLFKTLLEELRDSDGAELVARDPSRLSAKLERVLATSACHGSVRAGQSLSPNEARELAYQMERTESSLNCPHGRPASIRLSFSQIEGLFKRG